MRMSPNAETAGSPISSLDSDDMACSEFSDMIYDMHLD